MPFMTKCAHCRDLIAFGGMCDQDLPFCGRACVDAFAKNQALADIPEDMIAHRIQEERERDCPYCDDSGPLDFYHVRRCWKFMIVTGDMSEAHICCNDCGRQKLREGIWFNVLLGFWGIVFISWIEPIRNVVLNRRELKRNRNEPTEGFIKFVRSLVYDDLMARAEKKRRRRQVESDRDDRRSRQSYH